MNLTKYNPFV